MRLRLTLGLLLLTLLWARAQAADPRLPEGQSFDYTSLTDGGIVTLEFASGTVDSALVDGRLGIRQATWVGGEDDGLIWYFSESDTLDTARSAILFHGFSRPGWGGLYTPPFVWIPAPEELAVGYQWSWEGLDTLGDPLGLAWEVSAFEPLSVPRGTFQCWKLSTVEGGGLAAAGLDPFGRRVGDPEKLEGAPRWYANQSGFWLLVRDDERVVFGYGGVGAQGLSWGRLKALYEP